MYYNPSKSLLSLCPPPFSASFFFLSDCVSSRFCLYQHGNKEVQEKLSRSCCSAHALSASAHHMMTSGAAVYPDRPSLFHQRIPCIFYRPCSLALYGALQTHRYCSFSALSSSSFRGMCAIIASRSGTITTDEMSGASR